MRSISTLSNVRQTVFLKLRAYQCHHTIRRFRTNASVYRSMYRLMKLDILEYSHLLDSDLLLTNSRCSYRSSHGPLCHRAILQEFFYPSHSYAWHLNLLHHQNHPPESRRSWRQRHQFSLARWRKDQQSSRRRLSPLIVRSSRCQWFYSAS